MVSHILPPFFIGFEDDLRFQILARKIGRDAKLAAKLSSVAYVTFVFS